MRKGSKEDEGGIKRRRGRDEEKMRDVSGEEEGGIKRRQGRDEERMREESRENEGGTKRGGRDRERMRGIIVTYQRECRNGKQESIYECKTRKGSSFTFKERQQKTCKVTRGLANTVEEKK
jgi:hypothetical protein